MPRKPRPACPVKCEAYLTGVGGVKRHVSKIIKIKYRDALPCGRGAPLRFYIKALCLFRLAKENPCFNFPNIK